MNLLLDTHLLIWASTSTARVPKSASKLITNPANKLFFSSISIWEVAIKRGLERPDFYVEPTVLRRGLLDYGYRELAFTSEHAISVASLPLHHRDPFDRALIAQAVSGGLILLTSDKTLQNYSGVVRMV